MWLVFSCNLHFLLLFSCSRWVISDPYISLWIGTAWLLKFVSTLTWNLTRVNFLSFVHLQFARLVASSQDSRFAWNGARNLSCCSFSFSFFSLISILLQIIIFFLYIVILVCKQIINKCFVLAHPLKAILNYIFLFL